MNIKRAIITVLLLLIAVETVFYFVSKSEEKIASLSQKPTDWVNDAEIDGKKQDFVSIDIKEATEGRGDYDSNTQKLVDSKGELIAIQFNPFYNGKKFNNLYSENGKDLMRVNFNINPKDNIMDVFAVLKEEKYGLTIYAFVDDDWKTKSNGEIYLTWGDLKDKENMQTKKFSFEKSNKGVYTEKISKTEFLNQKNPYARIFIGEVTKQDIIEGNYNKTFLMIT